MKRWVLCIGLLAACPGWAGAAATPDAGTQNPFELGSGSRALALAGAYVAVADDVSALFWNPAGLSRLEQVELSAMHINLFFGTPYDFLGAAYPFLDWGTVAVGAARLATDGIAVRGEDSYLIGNGTGALDLREFRLGYGRDLPWGLSAGAVVKLDQERLLGDFANGVSLDLGCQFNYPGAAGGWEALTLGVAAQNVLGTPLQLGTEPDWFPMNLRVGAAYPLAFTAGVSQRFLLSLAAEKSTWRAWRWAAGAEYGLLDLFALRGGIKPDGWSAGAGLQAAGVALDYALAGEELGLTHRFTLTWRFGARRAEARQIRERRRQEDLDREAGLRAEKAVRAARDEMEDQLKKSQKKFQREKQALLAKQEAQINQAVAEERQRQTEQRNQDLEKEYFKSLHYFLGIKDYLGKKYASAVTEFETVEKYDPNYLELPLWLSRARAMAKGQMVTMSESNLALYYQGIDLYVENQFAEAIAVWKKILATEPNNLMALRNIEEAENRLNTLNGAKPASGEKTENGK